MRTTLDLDDELYERIKAVAKTQDRTIAGQLRHLISSALATYEDHSKIISSMNEMMSIKAKIEKEIKK